MTDQPHTDTTLSDFVVACVDGVTTIEHRPNGDTPPFCLMGATGVGAFSLDTLIEAAHEHNCV